jgi:hypothetical protein
MIGSKTWSNNQSPLERLRTNNTILPAIKSQFVPPSLAHGVCPKKWIWLYTYYYYYYYDYIRIYIYIYLYIVNINSRWRSGGVLWYTCLGKCNLHRYSDRRVDIYWATFGMMALQGLKMGELRPLRGMFHAESDGWPIFRRTRTHCSVTINKRRTRRHPTGPTIFDWTTAYQYYPNLA